MIEELRTAARALGFEVREEELLREVGYRARSGACRLNDRNVILVDRRLSPTERLDVLCGVLAGHDLDGVVLSPALRAMVEREPARPPAP